MSISVIAFIAWACVAMGFLWLLTNHEAVNPFRELRQIGDTSLGRYSIDWMGALAFVGAVVICCFIE